MSREIRFRVWDKNNEELILPERVAIHCDGELWIKVSNTYMAKQERDDYDFMQYTGLKDCNGVDIYCGDILKFWDWVGFIKFSGGVYLLEYKDKKDTCSTLFSSDKVMNNYEVIGNIYENGDLLK